MSRIKKDIPELFLEQLALDELSAERRGELSLYPADKELSERLEQLRESNQSILDAHPAPAMAASIKERAAVQAPTRPASRPIVLVIGFASAAAMVFLATWFFLATGSRPTDPADNAPGATSEQIRLKGDPQLIIHRKTAGQAQALQAGSIVRAGDRLQLSYSARGAAYGAILSLDGNGQVSLHFPKQADGSTDLEPAGMQQLDHSYELDDAPAYERFFFITCPTPVEVDDLMTGTSRLGKQGLESAKTVSLPVPAGCNQTSMLLRKAGR